MGVYYECPECHAFQPEPGACGRCPCPRVGLPLTTGEGKGPAPDERVDLKRPQPPQGVSAVGRTTRKADTGAGFHPATRPTSELDDVLVRVERAYLNEIAEKRQAEPAYSAEEIERVGGWLAGVSFNEWFALAAGCDRLREELAGADDLLAEADAVIRELADDLKDRYIPDKGWPPHIEHANRLVAELAARAALGVEGPAG